MKKLLQSLIRYCNGYPIVRETAPKHNVRFKVDRKDPAFERPFSELTKIYS